MTLDTSDILSRIDSPADLRKLPVEALPEVCKALRHKILEELSCNPGHLGSSLGAVELTVALHYVMDTPYDRLVWDVGHQAYAHKLLTGRRDAFDTNRKLGGLRPFPSPDESEYDTFVCGHASNSISAALGMAVAAVREGHDERKVVAVIGDGAMSGGLAFEGLNNASSTPNNLLIVLNDNRHSIDRAVGGMAQYLLDLNLSEGYNRLRYRLAQWGQERGWLNEERKKGIIRLGNSLKAALARQQNVFEGMNIRYFGPVDGHDVVRLVEVLRDIKEMKGPKMLHIHTHKGKGFAPAEKNQTIWHAPGRFDPETGERLVADTEGQPPLWQEVFGHTVTELARFNPRIVGVTPAMLTGCSLNIMQREMPDRVFDVGIAEGHAVTFSAGMAKDGLLPYCNIYSSFAQRAYDNVIHDAALSRADMVLCLDRAGLVGEDGPTHHGAFDLASLRPIPGITIASPYDEHELRALLFTAQTGGKGPFVIRYPRGRGVTVDWECPFYEVEIGRGRRLKEGKDVAVVTLGPIGHEAGKAIAQFEKESREAGHELTVAHYDLRFLKPIDEDLLHEIGRHFHAVVTVEDGARQGGMGSAVLEFMADHGYAPRVARIGIPDHFVTHGPVKDLYHLCGMDAEGILAELRSMTGLTSEKTERRDE
jgi:1-deoxy-D-xylulose-5-phosphate synthase